MHENTLEAATVRRRIIQQPLRTEASFALIASDASPLAELVERLKRTHPVIAFPSLSHFLAEPPRRDRWAAILVARSGAWDPRLDGYVRSRSRVALFGLSEESYGWPEAVARVRDVGELEPWLEALNAPELPPRKERVKRSARTHASAAPAQPKVRVSQTPQAASSAPGEAVQRPLDAIRDEPAPATPARPKQMELALPGLARKPRKLAPRSPRAVERPQPPARPLELVRSILAEHRARRVTAADRHADSEFAQLAAELGLVRARELLNELRARATQLVSALHRRSPSA